MYDIDQEIHEIKPIGSGNTHLHGLRLWNEILRQDREQAYLMFAPIRVISVARFEYLVKVQLSTGFSKYPRYKHLNSLIMNSRNHCESAPKTKIY